MPPQRIVRLPLGVAKWSGWSVCSPFGGASSDFPALSQAYPSWGVPWAGSQWWAKSIRYVTIVCRTWVWAGQGRRLVPQARAKLWVATTYPSSLFLKEKSRGCTWLILMNNTLVRLHEHWILKCLKVLISRQVGIAFASYFGVNLDHIARQHFENWTQMSVFSKKKYQYETFQVSPHFLC